MTKNRYYILLLVLGALTALAPFSIDMFPPGFPAIAKSVSGNNDCNSYPIAGHFIYLQGSYQATVAVAPEKNSDGTLCSSNKTVT